MGEFHQNIKTSIQWFKNGTQHLYPKVRRNAKNFSKRFQQKMKIKWQLLSTNNAHNKPIGVRERIKRDSWFFVPSSNCISSPAIENLSAGANEQNAPCIFFLIGVRIPTVNILDPWGSGKRNRVKNFHSRIQRDEANAIEWKLTFPLEAFELSAIISYINSTKTNLCPTNTQQEQV